MSVHIGKRIEKRLRELGMSKAEFGRRIETSRQNVSLILERPHIYTDQLQRICEALDFDFFQFYYRPTSEGGFKRRRKVFAVVQVEQDDLPDSFYEKYGID